jgi:hypothetical protein
VFRSIKNCTFLLLLRLVYLFCANPRLSGWQARSTRYHQNAGAMKTLIAIALFSTVLLSAAAQSSKKKSTNKASQKVVTSKAEQEAIKEVIALETRSFFETNKQAWRDCWVHAPHSYWSFADTTDVNFYKGWENIEKGFEDYFRMSKPAKVTIDNKWDEITIYGNVAYVHFRQKVGGDGIERSELSEVRVLEKGSDGKWRIVHMGAVSKQREP